VFVCEEHHVYGEEKLTGSYALILESGSSDAIELSLGVCNKKCKQAVKKEVPPLGRTLDDEPHAASVYREFLSMNRRFTWEA